ncbi:hypothetical protein ACOJBO_10070 [Rhizobium beringeri]
MTFKYANDSDLHAKLITDVLSQYPDKAAKRRSKHLSLATSEKDANAISECEVKSNIKSVQA